MLRAAIISLLSVTLLVVGVLGDGYVLDPTDTRIYDAKRGCVDVTTVVPYNFSVCPSFAPFITPLVPIKHYVLHIRLDATEFQCENDTCINVHNKNEVLKLNREPLGKAERVNLNVCDPQKHAWLGFDISSMLSDSRHGFHTIFFSQADTWSVTKETSCIQVQKSLPINVLAMGKESVELSCAIKSTCKTHPTTIYTVDHDLCRHNEPLQCRIENPDNETIVYKTTLGKPQKGRYSFAYCKTEHANVAYVIDWEGQ